eukprot:gene6667-9440_t
MRYDDEINEAYRPLLSPALSGQMALVLLILGIFFAGRFFVYEVSRAKTARWLTREISLALLSSLFLGVGVFFLSVYIGIPV